MKINLGAIGIANTTYGLGQTPLWGLASARGLEPAANTLAPYFKGKADYAPNLYGWHYPGGFYLVIRSKKDANI